MKFILAGALVLSLAASVHAKTFTITLDGTVDAGSQSVGSMFGTADGASLDLQPFKAVFHVNDGLPGQSVDIVTLPDPDGYADIFGNDSNNPLSASITINNVQRNFREQSDFGFYDLTNGLITINLIDGLYNHISFTVGTGIPATSYAGPAAYSMTPTDYNVNDFRIANVSQGELATGDLTVSSVSISPSAVPEPATYALVIGGLGIVGGALRRRGNMAVKAHFA